MNQGEIIQNVALLIDAQKEVVAAQNSLVQAGEALLVKVSSLERRVSALEHVALGNGNAQRLKGAVK